MEKLNTFIQRLNKLGIKIELINNFPWVVHFHKINDQLITEKFYSEYGFTIGFLPIRKDREFQFTDITEIFKIIRKYEKL